MGNGEMRKCGNAEMGNGGQKRGPQPPLRPRYSWPYGRQGERRDSQAVAEAEDW